MLPAPVSTILLLFADIPAPLSIPVPSMSLWQTQAEQDLAHWGCRIWLHLDFIALLFSLLAPGSDWTWWGKVKSVWASAPDCCWHWSTDSHEYSREHQDNRKALLRLFLLPGGKKNLCLNLIKVDTFMADMFIFCMEFQVPHQDLKAF